jgi:integrase
MATAKPRKNKDGSIISYEIRVSLGRDMNGKQILKYHTWTPEPAMTQRQIDKALEREKVLFEERCRRGYVLDTSTKFADFAARWLELNEGKHSPGYQKLAADLLVRVNAGIGHIQLGKLRPHHIQAFYANLAEDGVKNVEPSATSDKLAALLKEKELTRAAVGEAAGVSAVTVTTACQGKTIKLETAKKIADALDMEVVKLFKTTVRKSALADKTLQRYYSLVSAILGAAVQLQAIPENPAARVVKPKGAKKEAAYLDDKEALQVMEKLTTAPLKWRTVIMLLLYSGMRRGELCGLMWSDLDFDNNLVHITKANQYLSGKGIFEKGTKNEASNRVIKMPEAMFSLLREYRGWQSEERLKIGDRWQDSGKVFTQENGQPMHPSSVTGWVRDFREAHGLPHFTPHTLRHTSATLLIMQGVPVKAVSARLGHASQNTTNAVYSHAIQTVDAMASDVLGNVLQQPEQKTGQA